MSEFSSCGCFYKHLGDCPDTPAHTEGGSARMTAQPPEATASALRDMAADFNVEPMSLSSVSTLLDRILTLADDLDPQGADDRVFDLIVAERWSQYRERDRAARVQA